MTNCCCQIQINPLFDTYSICYGSLWALFARWKATKKRETNSSKYLNKTCNEIIFFTSSVSVFVLCICLCVHRYLYLRVCVLHMPHTIEHEWIYEWSAQKNRKNEEERFFILSFFYIVCPAFRHCCHFVVVNVFFSILKIYLSLALW